MMCVIAAGASTHGPGVWNSASSMLPTDEARRVTHDTAPLAVKRAALLELKTIFYTSNVCYRLDVNDGVQVGFDFQHYIAARLDAAEPEKTSTLPGDEPKVAVVPESEPPSAA